MENWYYDSVDENSLEWKVKLRNISETTIIIKKRENTKDRYLEGLPS